MEFDTTKRRRSVSTTDQRTTLCLFFGLVGVGEATVSSTRNCMFLKIDCGRQFPRLLALHRFRKKLSSQD